MLVHGEDIRRPLGIRGDYRNVAGRCSGQEIRHQTGVGAGLGGAKQLVKGVRVRTTDTDLDLGEGPLVEGSAIALLLVLCGRAVALDELSGPGAETLAGRI